MDLRTERGAPHESAETAEHDLPHDLSYESAENDVAVEKSTERTENTKRDSPQPESDPRSHAALLSDLAQLTEDDIGFFRD